MLKGDINEVKKIDNKKYCIVFCTGGIGEAKKIAVSDLTLTLLESKKEVSFNIFDKAMVKLVKKNNKATLSFLPKEYEQIFLNGQLDTIYDIDNNIYYMKNSEFVFKLVNSLSIEDKGIYAGKITQYLIAE